MTTDTQEQGFPATLKRFRNDWGLTQQQLADTLQIARNTLKAWERGDPKRQPHILTQEGAMARLGWLWLKLDEERRQLQSSPVANSPDSQ